MGEGKEWGERNTGSSQKLLGARLGCWCFLTPSCPGCGSWGEEPTKRDQLSLWVSILVSVTLTLCDREWMTFLLYGLQACLLPSKGNGHQGRFLAWKILKSFDCPPSHKLKVMLIALGPLEQGPLMVNRGVGERD